MEGFWDSGRFVLRSTIEERAIKKEDEISRLRQQIVELKTRLDDAGGRGKTFTQYIASVKELEAGVAARDLVIQQMQTVAKSYPRPAHTTGLFHLQEVFEQILTLQSPTEALDARDRAVAEACAKVCDALADESGCPEQALYCAEYIRAGEWRKYLEGK